MAKSMIELVGSNEIKWKVDSETLKKLLSLNL